MRALKIHLIPSDARAEELRPVELIGLRTRAGVYRTLCGRLVPRYACSLFLWTANCERCKAKFHRDAEKAYARLAAEQKAADDKAAQREAELAAKAKQLAALPKSQAHVTS